MWSSIIVTFLLGQGVLQSINLVSGFFLLRWLTKEEYAKYTVAFAFQSTAQMFVEFGFSGAIIALVGKNIHDKLLIGEYLKAGKYFRLRSFLLVSTVCVIIFPLIARKHHWELMDIIVILLAITSNLFFSGFISYYKPILQIHQKIRSIYINDIRVSVGRLGFLYIFYLFQFISGKFAVLINCLQTLIVGLFLRKKAGAYIEEPIKSDPLKRKEMIDYITPIIPGIIFAAFQSQISLFIISFFGNTSAIAEVGALGRLGQIFLILNTSSSMLIAPYIAKQEPENLKKKFLGVISLSILICILFLLFAYINIDMFIWFLGSQYSYLQNEILGTIISSCILFINGMLWSMNAARKWLFKWMPMVTIPGVLLVQTLGVIFMDLSVVSNVILFNIFSSIFILCTRIAVSYCGFKNKR